MWPCFWRFFEPMHRKFCCFSHPKTRKPLQTMCILMYYKAGCITSMYDWHCYFKSTDFVRRDIVDTSNHASCVFGRNKTKQVGFPTVWEGSGKKKWVDLLLNAFQLAWVYSQLIHLTLMHEQVCWSVFAIVMSTNFVRRDIVDTSNHASCVFGRNKTKQVGFPTVWEGSGKKKWVDLL